MTASAKSSSTVMSFEQQAPTRKKWLSRIPLYIVLILLALFFILPLVWMMSTAFKPFREVLQPNWLPINPTLENFTGIFSDPTVPVYNWFLNSVLISTLFTLAILIVDSLAGYAYARMEFPGRDVLFGLLIATLVMPSLMFLIPNYITISQLGWINQYQGVILPGLAGVFGVFYMRQFFQGLPRELEEAARIDGANAWQIFFQVALPLSYGALATLGVLSFLASWNDFLWPYLVLTERTSQTLPAGLATLQGQYTFDYGKLMAGAAVTAIPVLIIYVFLQRYIVESVKTTGLRG
jgi:multiple sugar transport system permease protein